MKRMMQMIRIVAAGSLLVATSTFAAPAASAASYSVTIKDYAYAPASLTVQAGDTVTWTNKDTAKHDVATTSGPKSFRSPYLATGESWSYTFTTAGTYSYYCSLHPDMRAQVTAKAAPATTKQTTTRQTTAAPASTPVAQAPATQGQPAATQAPAATTKSGGKSKSASASATSSPSATTPPAVQAESAPAAESSLDPMLLVTGVAVAVAVFCLLLLGSRRSH